MEPCYNMNSSCGRTYRNNMQNQGCRQMQPSPAGMCNPVHHDCASPRPSMPNKMMEMECVCKTKKKCHTPDAMTVLDENFPPVMSYVPWQQWGELYKCDCGLKQGTIFKDLNYIFCGVRC